MTDPRCGEHGVPKATCAGWRHHEKRKQTVEYWREKARVAEAELDRYIKAHSAALWAQMKAEAELAELRGHIRGSRTVGDLRLLQQYIEEKP